MWQLDRLSAKSLWGHSLGHGVQPRMNCLVIDSEINSTASGGYITLLTHYWCSWMVMVDYWQCKWMHLTQQVERDTDTARAVIWSQLGTNGTKMHIVTATVQRFREQSLQKWQVPNTTIIKLQIHENMWSEIPLEMWFSGKHLPSADENYLTSSSLAKWLNVIHK